MKEHIRKIINLKNIDKNKFKNIKHVRWLLPGWVGFEYYKLARGSGMSKKKSLKNFAKAEAMRFSALSIPLPGSYEMATTTMALLKKKLEKEDLEEIKFSMLTNKIRKSNKYFKYKIGKYSKLRKPMYKRKLREIYRNFNQ